MDSHIQEVSKFIARVGNRAIWRLIGSILLLGVGIYLLVTVYLASRAGHPFSKSLLTLGIGLAIGGVVGAIDVIPEVRRSTSAWKASRLSCRPWTRTSEPQTCCRRADRLP
jgi:hypothetical protein